MPTRWRPESRRAALRDRRISTAPEGPNPTRAMCARRPGRLSVMVPRQGSSLRLSPACAHGLRNRQRFRCGVGAGRSRGVGRSSPVNLRSRSRARGGRRRRGAANPRRHQSRGTRRRSPVRDRNRRARPFGCDRRRSRCGRRLIRRTADRCPGRRSTCHRRRGRTGGRCRRVPLPRLEATAARAGRQHESWIGRHRAAGHNRPTEPAVEGSQGYESSRGGSETRGGLCLAANAAGTQQRDRRSKRRLWVKRLPGCLTASGLAMRAPGRRPAPRTRSASSRRRGGGRPEAPLAVERRSLSPASETRGGPHLP